MLGAIIGDIVGSRFEWDNIKTKNFTLFAPDCRMTDDSLMTLAIGQALLECRPDRSDLGEKAIFWMRSIGRRFPNCGFGGRFRQWLMQWHPRPYNSFGNGAAMRVSACGEIASSLEEAASLARAVTEVTHDHPEGLRGAEATACAIYLAKTGHTKAQIRAYTEQHFYVLDFTLDSIRADYTFDVTCQGSVPQAIEAFLESADFEDAVRNAVSIGGDSDTIAAITGSIAAAFYGIPADIREKALTFVRDGQLRDILTRFESRCAAGENQQELSM